MTVQQEAKMACQSMVLEKVYNDMVWNIPKLV